MRAAAAVAAALVLAPAAAGHGDDGASAGYRSTVSGVEPNVVGVLVTVLGGDDRLRVVNYSGKVVLVSGYDNEPFLRFTNDGVYENARSPATYLSRERDPAAASVPASADPAAPPSWRRIAAAAESVVWHDHRIHWVRDDPPPAVREEPDKPHLVFRWRIPATADGAPFAITGFLGYSPPPDESSGSRPSPWIFGAVVAVSVVAIAALGVGARRARRRAPT